MRYLPVWEEGGVAKPFIKTLEKLMKRKHKRIKGITVYGNTVRVIKQRADNGKSFLYWYDAPGSPDNWKLMVLNSNIYKNNKSNRDKIRLRKIVERQIEVMQDQLNELQESMEKL